MVLPEAMLIYAAPSYVHLAMGTPYWHPEIEMPPIHHEDRFTRDRVESDDAAPVPKRSLMTRAKNAINRLLVRLHLKKAPQEDMPNAAGERDSLPSVSTTAVSELDLDV